MMRNKTPPNIQRRKRGFGLTELTIVVGILGLVLGGIWTAAATVRNNFNEQDLLKKFVYISGNLHVFNNMNVPGAGDVTLSDSCGSTPPCSSNMFLQAGVFPSDFITANRYVSGAPYGAGPNLYITKYDYVLWTGVENAEVYDSQAGVCPGGVCPSAPTVVEIDLFNMPVAVCSKLLLDIFNTRMDQLYSVSTGINGTAYNWGPAFVASKGGTAAIPNSFTLSAATKACSGNYTLTTTQLWVLFIVR